MKFLFKNLLVVLVFYSFVCGQNSDIEELKNLHLKNEGLETSISNLEERLDTLVEKLSVIGEKDKAEAKRLNAEVRRLFPCCPLAGVEREMFGMDSGYAFRTEKTVDGYFAVSLFYQDEEFSFSEQDGNHGFILNAGKIPLENVSEKHPAFAALSKYEPPFEIENIKKEFIADDIGFRQSAPVKIGDTYLLRVVSYAADGNIDSLFALKVARRDADGSIIVFIKKLKDFPLPKREKKVKYTPGEIYDAGMTVKIQGILREQGINDVRLEFVDRDLIVKGSVPTGKIEEVIKLVTDLNPSYKVKNELVEK